MDTPDHHPSTNAWGLPILQPDPPDPPDPPAQDAELGVTCDEDDNWEPHTQTRLPLPVTRTIFAGTLLLALHTHARLFVLRHRLQYGRNRKHP